MVLDKRVNYTWRRFERLRSLGFTGFIIEIVFLGVILGFLQNGMPNWPAEGVSQYVGHVLRFLVPILLLIWANQATRSERHELWLRSITVMLALLLAIPVFFKAEISSITSSFVLVARNFVAILVYTMLFNKIREYDINPAFVFSIIRGAFSFALTFGLCLSVYSDLPIFVAGLDETVIYFLLTCMLILFFSSYSRVYTWILRNKWSEIMTVRVATVDEQCDTIASRYKLSERELEVLRLLAQGRTKRYIAETLYISEDTIRWHSKGIYRKLGIHSKQELLTKLGFK